MSTSDTNGNWTCTDYNNTVANICYSGYYTNIGSATTFTITYYYTISNVVSSSTITYSTNRGSYDYYTLDLSVVDTWSYTYTGSTNFNYPINVTLLSRSVTGYTVKWNENDKGAGRSFDPGSTIYTGSSWTFYSIETANLYNITYKDSDGTTTLTGLTPTTINYNSLYTPPTPPIKTGYGFDGWYLNSSYTGTRYNAQFTWTFTSSTTFYAKYTPNSYTLNWNANNIGTGKSLLVTYASSNQAPTLYAVGWTFNGWYSSNLGGTPIVTAGGSYNMPAADTTLYAQWNQISDVKFSYLQNTYGGSKPISISAYQAYISKLAKTPTKLSFDFKGKGPAPP